MNSQENLNKFLQDEFLLDIAFEDYQMQELIKMRSKNVLNKMASTFDEMIQALKTRKERLINEYRIRYETEPDVEHAKRLFSYHRKANDVKGGSS